MEALTLMGYSGRVSLDARRRPAEWSAGRRMRMVDPIGIVGCIRPAIANDSNTRSGDAVPWSVGNCWILVVWVEIYSPNIKCNNRGDMNLALDED